MKEGNQVLHTVLQIKDVEYTVTDSDNLQEQLHTIQQVEFAEVWLERGSEVTSLLTNRDQNRAFLMFLTDDNPAGFHAISDSEATVDGEIKFLLDNGQADEFDRSDTIALPDGIRALEYFFLHGGRTSLIQWHDDSL